MAKVGKGLYCIDCHQSNRLPLKEPCLGRCDGHGPVTNTSNGYGEAMPLHYVKGDATKPQGEGPKIIAHCCNDLGRWGAGFVVSLAKRYGKARDAYYAWYKSAHKIPGETTGRMGLGEAQLVQVEDELWVANIVGQHGVGMGSGGRPPIRYDALRRGLVAVHRWAVIHKATVHMPKMGSGLAGGHWGNIEQMVKTELVDRGLDVTVYTLK